MIVNSSKSSYLITTTGERVVTLSGGYIATFYILTTITLIGDEEPRATVNVAESVPLEYPGAVVYGIEKNAAFGVAVIDSNTGVLRYAAPPSSNQKITLSLSATYSNGLRRIFPYDIIINRLSYDPDITEKLVGYV